MKCRHGQRRGEKVHISSQANNFICLKSRNSELKDPMKYFIVISCEFEVGMDISPENHWQ